MFTWMLGFLYPISKTTNLDAYANFRLAPPWMTPYQYMYLFGVMKSVRFVDLKMLTIVQLKDVPSLLVRCVNCATWHLGPLFTKLWNVEAKYTIIEWPFAGYPPQKWCTK
jgi:hypothetical protein